MSERKYVNEEYARREKEKKPIGVSFLENFKDCLMNADDLKAAKWGAVVALRLAADRSVYPDEEYIRGVITDDTLKSLANEIDNL